MDGAHCGTRPGKPRLNVHSGGHQAYWDQLAQDLGSIYTA